MFKPRVKVRIRVRKRETERERERAAKLSAKCPSSWPPITQFEL